MVFRADKKQSKEVYLNEPVGADKEGNEITLLDVLEADGEDVVERLAFYEDVKTLYKNMEKLQEPEKTILRMRYGLSGYTQKTQREIAEEMGISRSYVSRIEKRAVEKIRKMFVENFTK
jgi:RNA polymerase sporulation-specific sigma factor